MKCFIVAVIIFLWNEFSDM